MSDDRPFTEVAAGIVHRRAAGGEGHWEVLMGQRPAGKAYAGWWEFPGGKLEAGETVATALAREMREELDVRVARSLPWVVREHAYPHARVRLHFHRIFDWSGEPHGLEGQAFDWQSLDRITLSPLLPAALPLLEMLRWPARLGVWSMPSGRVKGNRQDIKAPDLEAANEAANEAAFSQLLERARSKGVGRLMIELPEAATQRAEVVAGGVATMGRLAQSLGVQIFPPDGLGCVLEAPGIGGYWRKGLLKGIPVRELLGRGGLFSAASLSDADDLARSAGQGDGSSLTWSVQACALMDVSVAHAEGERLVSSAAAPLYWPDGALLALGGHGELVRL